MAITTELIVARHGEATCNITGIVGGEQSCTGLTDHGRQQAHQLAARLANEHTVRPFDALYATPRLRVRQTADIVGTRLDLTATITPDLRGPDHGEADGKPWHDIKTEFGGPPQHSPDQPYAPAPRPGTNTSTAPPTPCRRSWTSVQDSASSSSDTVRPSKPPTPCSSNYHKTHACGLDSSPTTPALPAGNSTSTDSDVRSGCWPRTTTPPTSNNTDGHDRHR